MAMPSTKPRVMTLSNSDSVERIPPSDNLVIQTRDWTNWRVTDQDYGRLREVVLELLSIDLNLYRTQQMERRLTMQLERRRFTNWADYIRALRRDPQELALFADSFTINVSSFYRDAKVWTHFTTQVLPELIDSTGYAGLRAWSAGCSIGAEPYTLAMLLRNQAPQRSHRIWATDIDDTVLARARQGGPYSETELRELPEPLQQRYLQPSDERFYTVHPTIRSMVAFEHVDLLRDDIKRKFDLVICRNVVIYFATTVKAFVYRRLIDTLKPGGILFLGSTESIPNPGAFHVDYIGPSMYRYLGP